MEEFPIGSEIPILEETYAQDLVEGAFVADMKDMVEILDSCNVILEEVYKHKNEIDAANCIAITPEKNNVGPKDAGK